MHQSLVRNGNHFVRMEFDDSAPAYRGKWLLIDGPWFEYLEGMTKREGITEVLLRPYHRMSSVVQEELRPVYHQPEFTWWTRYEVPYYRVGKRQLLNNINQMIDLAARMSKYQNVHYGFIDSVLVKHMVFTAWQCNYGALPAWIKNEHWDENLEELFSFTTYDSEILI